MRLDTDQDVDEDISEQSTKMLSDVSVSSDSILRPTKSIVAGSRKLFDQLEQEEQALEREFASFRNSNIIDIGTLPINEIEGVPDVTLPKPESTMKFYPQQNIEPGNKSVSTVPASKKLEKPVRIKSPEPIKTSAPPPAHQALSEEDNQSQSTITPSAGVGTVTPGDAQNTDIMENLDPVMQQYLNRVLQKKEENGAGKTVQQTAAQQDDTEHIEHVEFDKTDSDFSW